MNHLLDGLDTERAALLGRWDMFTLLAATPIAASRLARPLLLGAPLLLLRHLAVTPAWSPSVPHQTTLVGD